MTLTPRQLEIGRLAHKGYTAPEIAELTGLSQRTVEEHVWQAGHRLPGGGRPRERLILWIALHDEDLAA